MARHPDCLQVRWVVDSSLRNMRRLHPDYAALLWLSEAPSQEQILRVAEELNGRARQLEKLQADARIKAWKSRMTASISGDHSEVCKWLRGPQPGAIRAIRTAEGLALTPDAAVEAVHKAWEPILRAYVDNPKPAWEDIKTMLPDTPRQALEVPPLTATILRDHLRKTPSKAAGLDGWTVDLLRRLPGELLDDLAGLLNEIERGADWPEPLLQAVTVLLPKSEECNGDPLKLRPITHASCVYRLWSVNQVQAGQ